MPTQPTYCWLHSTYSVGARYKTVQALLSVLPNFCQFFAETSVSFCRNFCQFLQKLLSVFCRNGLYPCWCRMCRGAVGFWGLFVFFDTPDNTSLFKIEESIILWDHPQSLCQFSHRTKTIRTIKFPLQLYSVHRSAGGKTGTVCLPAKIFFFGIKICWI